MTNKELCAFLFAPPTAQVEDTFTDWFLQSRRFQAFVVEYKTKIRKKLRLARTPQNLQSLLWELEIARQLVEAPRCRVEYEKYGQHQERNPDLTVTFRTHTCFNLEVTWMQMAQEEAEGRIEKFLRTVCDKVGQCVPQMLNCLVIATQAPDITHAEVDAAMKSLKRRVEQREREGLLRVKFNTPSDFYKQFQWLNGIVLCCPSQPAGNSQTIVWMNSQSRYHLPPDILIALQTLISRSLTTLPALNSLVRASEQPLQVQEGVLLRAATEGNETPAEEMLRASGEEKRYEHPV